MNYNLNKFSVSVVIPVRGKIELLTRALNSCITQTLLPAEIVLIDDNVNVGESRKVEIIASRFKKLVETLELQSSLIFSKSGGGASSARNLGTRFSNSNFIAFLDADDYFLPDKLATQVSKMLESDSDMSHTNYIIRNAELGLSKIADTSFNQGLRQDSLISYRGCGIATPTVMIRKSLLNGWPDVFPVGITVGEDLVAWARLCHLSSKPLLHIKEVLTVVDVNTTSSAFSSENINLAKMHLKMNAEMHNIQPLQIYEYGGLKKIIRSLVPFPPAMISYLLNILRAIRGR